MVHLVSLSSRLTLSIYNLSCDWNKHIPLRKGTRKEIGVLVCEKLRRHKRDRLFVRSIVYNWGEEGRTKKIMFMFYLIASCFCFKYLSYVELGSLGLCFVKGWQYEDLAIYCILLFFFSLFGVMYCSTTSYH